MSIKINTGTVVTVANNIAEKNTQIRNDFLTMEYSVNRLTNDWSGDVAQNALRVFGDIKKGYNDNRYNVVNDYVGFLMKQVGESYDTTEKAIQSVAAAFK